MCVSKNRGFSPQIIHFRVFHYFHHPFWDTPIFWNHPYVSQLLQVSGFPASEPFVQVMKVKEAWRGPGGGNFRGRQKMHHDGFPHLFFFWHPIICGDCRNQKFPKAFLIGKFSSGNLKLFFLFDGSLQDTWMSLKVRCWRFGSRVVVWFFSDGGLVLMILTISVLCSISQGYFRCFKPVGSPRWIAKIHII